MSKSLGRRFVLREHDAGWAIIDTAEIRERIVVLCAKDADAEATLTLLNQPAIVVQTPA